MTDNVPLITLLGSLDMFSPLIATITAAATAVLVPLFCRFNRWSIIEFPAKRSRTLGAAALCLLFSLFPAIYIFDRLLAEEVTYFQQEPAECRL